MTLLTPVLPCIALCCDFLNMPSAFPNLSYTARYIDKVMQGGAAGGSSGAAAAGGATDQANKAAAALLEMAAAAAAEAREVAAAKLHKKY